MFTVTDGYVVWQTSGGEWIAVFKLILGGIVSFFVWFGLFFQVFFFFLI